jgi:hypothetical protein
LAAAAAEMDTAAEILADLAAAEILEQLAQ